MAASRPTLDRLAQALTAAAPTLDADEQRLALILYRRLADGDPVPPSSLAADLHLPEARVQAALDGWPGVYRDEAGDVIGFWGLALDGMPHRFETDRGAIRTWCAIDPLLIAPLLDVQEARVRSRDPVTGESISIVIGADGTLEAEPETTVMSMLAPEGDFDHDVVETFCHFVWFFASPESGRPWIQDHQGTFLLTLEEASAVARRSWPALFVDALR